eukprot:TRINITY_DN2315_c0_g1_i1.p2 TRINITY_DN2315_c0_g1~~TRINITY_DN2315_c0_g1_i1.p2  ORF type:complete len:102 (-),score=26.15 TRINITY_DN2315_c0_g1_i1:35-340(-)
MDGSKSNDGELEKSVKPSNRAWGRRQIVQGVLLSSVVILSACGGGGSDDDGGDTTPPTATNKTGHLIDSAVSGVDYTASPSEIGRAVQQECRDRSRMPSSA